MARPSRRREIPRFPYRIELLLVLPQAAKVIEVLAVPVHEPAETMPRRRERATLEPRQRRHAEIELLVAFVSAHSISFTKRYSITPRGASLEKRMRSAEAVCFASLVQTFANATISPVAPRDRHRKVREVLGVEETRARIPSHVCASPRASHPRRPASSGQQRFTCSAATISNVVPLRSTSLTVRRRPRRLPPSSENSAKLHVRFFTELQQREPEIDAQREQVTAHLIEHRPAAMPVRELAESPRELGMLRRWSERIAERDPAAARHAVHDERLASLAEQQRLVAEQRQVCAGHRDSGSLPPSRERDRSRGRRVRGGAGRSSRRGRTRRRRPSSPPSREGSAAHPRRSRSATRCRSRRPRVRTRRDRATRCPTSTSANAAIQPGVSGSLDERGASEEMLSRRNERRRARRRGRAPPRSPRP